MAEPSRDPGYNQWQKEHTPRLSYEQRHDRATGFVEDHVPEGMQPYINNPDRFYTQAFRGRAGPLRRMGMAAAGQSMLGMDKALMGIEGSYLDSLGRFGTDPNMAGDVSLRGGVPYSVDMGQGDYGLNLREGSTPSAGRLSDFARRSSADVNQYLDTTPTVGRVEQYVGDRLGVGLTDAERSAISQKLRTPVEGAYQENLRLGNERAAAAGIDPRSGLASAAFGRIASERGAGLANAAAETELMNLQRKGEIEALAQQQAQLEEARRQALVSGDLQKFSLYSDLLNRAASMEEGQRQFNVGAESDMRQLKEAGRQYDVGTLARMRELQEAGRQFDVGADIQRRNQVESGLFNVAGLQQRRFQDYLDFQQSKKEAELARRMWEEYGDSLEPSTLERVAGGISGFLGGLTGGGGGGMGGMAGMMGGGGS